jgi:galactokinase
VQSQGRAREAFTRRFGRPPLHVTRAPGRVEILGNHTDYNEGLVLSAAIDRDLAIAIAGREDTQIRIASVEEGSEVVLSAGNVCADGIVPWARYVAGVLAKLAARGVGLPGFDAAIASDVPSGGGLSSSAALEVATALAVRAVQPFRLADDRGAMLDDAERWQLATLCRSAEQEIVGVPCGLLDHVSVLFGAPNALLYLDCRVPSVDTLRLGGATFVLADSGVRHALTDGAYTALAALCANAARTLGVRALRDVAPAEIERLPPALAAAEAGCVRHVVAENARVAQAAAAVRAGDLRTVGRLMTESHASSRDLLRNSTPELDLLVELATAEPACFGARLTGGGFGGSTVSLVAGAVAEDFARRLAVRFEQRTGRPIVARCLGPGAGAG